MENSHRSSSSNSNNLTVRHAPESFGSMMSDTLSHSMVSAMTTNTLSDQLNGVKRTVELRFPSVSHFCCGVSGSIDDNSDKSTYKGSIRPGSQANMLVQEQLYAHGSGNGNGSNSNDIIWQITKIDEEENVLKMKNIIDRWNKLPFEGLSNRIEASIKESFRKSDIVYVSIAHSPNRVIG